MLLRVHDVAVQFPAPAAKALHAVDGVSFEVAEGEILGVVGESGSGKSMTAAAILGLVPEPGRMVRGQLHLDGVDLSGLSQDRLTSIRGKDLAAVFQNPQSSLNPTLTIGWQLREAVRAHARVRRREANERAVAALAEVDIPEPRARLKQYPHELSGGMRQRVAIAMGLINGPRLLIADEPTSSLDATIQAQIIALLRRLVDERAMSVIFISHDLGVVSMICDRVAVMYAGQIVEQGPTRAVLEGPLHPYTRALMDAIPPVEPVERLRAIPGASVSMVEPEPGCRFMPRCPYAVDACNDDPQLWPRVDAPDSGHQGRCWVSRAYPSLDDAVGDRAS